MAYTYPYEPTQPNGATDPAKNAPADMKAKEAMMVERIEDFFGTDFTDDPMLIARIGSGANQAATVSSKMMYKATYDAGNSGSAKTLDFVANGPVQKVTLTASCTFTIAVPPDGATGQLRLYQNATGGWSVSFPVTWKPQAGVTPVYITTANKLTIINWTSDGTFVYYGTFGTGF